MEDGKAYGCESDRRGRSEETSEALRAKDLAEESKRANDCSTYEKSDDEFAQRVTDGNDQRHACSG